MTKVIDFFREKYKVLIPVMVLFVLLIALFFLYREYKYDNTRKKQEVSVYQYFGGMKNEYTAVVTYNLKNLIVDLTAKNKKIEYDSIPVYFSDSNKVLFPREMAIVFPLREGSQFKLYKYATYYKDENLNYINNNDNQSTSYDNFFLYDGKDVFFFPDEVMLQLDGKDYKKLGDGSYVSVVGGFTLIYYDTNSDTSEVIELDGKNVTVKSEHIHVNVSERYCMSFGKKVLLFAPDNLNPVFKTIDN